MKNKFLASLCAIAAAAVLVMALSCKSEEDEAADNTTSAVGRIICSDGTVVTKDNYDSTTMTAIAIICGGTCTDGTQLAVGLSEGSSLKWTQSNTTGYKTIFTATVCTPSATGSGAASTATFTGDTYGGDNWTAVCTADNTASTNTATNYPAFNYANTYGSTYCSGTNYTSGWYVPSISELCTLYKNMTLINASLSIVGGTQIDANMYWSSSQCSGASALVWSVDFTKGFIKGSVDSCYKAADNHVRVIRAF